MDTHLISWLTILVVGIAAQWIAWRVNFPSILLLLLCGLFVGPLTGFLDPDKLLGEQLPPLVSLAVALILYEGGLSLKLSEWRRVGSVVGNLVVIGPLVTWILATFFLWWIFPVSLHFSLLIGALFIVTGPTVIGPMLRYIRPVGSAGPILKWEGIVTDPLGVMVAILVFETIIHGGDVSASHTLVAIAKTIVAGGGLGFCGAWILGFLLRRHMLPDYLQNPWSIMMVLVVYGACEAIQTEAGLLAVTVMGVVLANQKRTHIKHIIEFKENLQILLISILFILLAARLDRVHIQAISWRHGLFLLLLILVVRPAAVWLSTFRSNLPVKERIFLCAMAPRGIVSAAMASVLALELESRAMEEGKIMVPLVFFVIMGTVLIYGLGAPIVARQLGISAAQSRGVLILGAHEWVQAFGLALQQLGSQVLLLDSNRKNVNQAKMAGLPVQQVNILAEESMEDTDLSGMGIFLAMTPNDEVNSLACLKMDEIFNRSDLFQLTAEEHKGSEEELEQGGRRLFGKGIRYDLMLQKFREGWVFKSTRLSAEFTLEHYHELYGQEALPLLVVGSGGVLRMINRSVSIEPREGDRLLGMVLPKNSSETVPE